MPQRFDSRRARLKKNIHHLQIMIFRIRMDTPYREDKEVAARQSCLLCSNPMQSAAIEDHNNLDKFVGMGSDQLSRTNPLHGNPALFPCGIRKRPVQNANRRIVHLLTFIGEIVHVISLIMGTIKTYHTKYKLNLRSHVTMNSLERFNACLNYQPGIPRPNHELGAWPQAVERWKQEGAPPELTGNYFPGCEILGLEPRFFVPVNFRFSPPFEYEVLEENDEYVIFRRPTGIVSKALKEGAIGNARMSMDQFLEFPVKERSDWEALKKRLRVDDPTRYPENLPQLAEEWKNRDCPWILGQNVNLAGFFWRAREYLGTERLAYAWYDEPEMMEDMMQYTADFIIGVAAQVLEYFTPDYICLNEDLAMKSGPLLSPAIFKKFIFPHLKRVCEFLHSRGVKHIAVDSDGNPELLVPLFLDAGVDILWPLERASDVNPLEWRRKFGRSLLMWGGVDKRILPMGRQAIARHLCEFIPLVEEGGFIPHLDHTFPPDISWQNMCDYLELKRYLLNGDFARLETESRHSSSPTITVSMK
ncbi:MAG: hypothetical protein D6820_14585 [Lentisphaerae bacterium]|nr:MAG: hypothetical protein D6820_14585 [Lentisphaerota bacterium]